MSTVLGTVFYSIVLFIAGAAIGRPLWNWTFNKFMRMISGN